MHIAYFDCFSGISGDMILGAFLDLGLPAKMLRQTLSLLPLPDMLLSIKREERSHISGMALQVKGKKGHHQNRTYRSIKVLIEKSRLEAQVKENSLEILTRLARVEGKIHGIELEEVHFHEIGALDTIVDIVGAALAVRYFEIDEVFSSPLPVSQGWIQSGHGRLPLPAPATLALLKGASITPDPTDRELVTPTGAAILTHYARSFGPPPAMGLKGSGYGLGQTRLPDRPNALRIWLGEKTFPWQMEKLMVLETNIDDMNPQWYEHLLEHLFEAGALDCLLIPCQMKKNRPAVLLQVLSKPETLPALQHLILRETTTLGLRFYEVDRLSLGRAIRTVKTPWGAVHIKQVIRPGDSPLHPVKDFSIEYEDLKKISQSQKSTLKEMDAAIRAWMAKHRTTD
ncbi:MAG: nickel pincer cofactor biosynthesis protein LarC [Thermodesulfobacteriota bacterium]